MRRGQTAIGGMLFVVSTVIIVLMVWLFMFSDLLSDWGAAAVTAGNLTGMTAFLWGNLNLYVLLGLLVFIVAGGYAAVRA